MEEDGEENIEKHAKFRGGENYLNNLLYVGGNFTKRMVIARVSQHLTYFLKHFISRLQNNE